MSTACSLSLMFNDLSVLPMYYFPHEQGTIFIIVLEGVNAILMLCLFRILEILYFVPFMYGKDILGMLKVFFTLLLFRVRWMVLLMIFLL